MQVTDQSLLQNKKVATVERNNSFSQGNLYFYFYTHFKNKIYIFCMINNKKKSNNGKALYFSSSLVCIYDIICCFETSNQNNHFNVIF